MQEATQAQCLQLHALLQNEFLRGQALLQCSWQELTDALAQQLVSNVRTVDDSICDSATLVMQVSDYLHDDVMPTLHTAVQQYAKESF